MISNLRRSLVLVMIASLAGCGTVMERNDIRSAVAQGNQAVSDRMALLRHDDQQKAAVVREVDGVWLGKKTVKVSRDAELPAVFSEPIRFAFPDQPTLTVIADRISKIVGMPVRVSADALIPIEVFSAQRMGMMMGGMGGSSMMQSAAGGMAAANGVRLPSGVAMPPQSGPIGPYAPSMSMMSGYPALPPARSFIIDQTTPFGGTLTELLDQVSGKFGVGWDYKDGAILISRLVTRTYQIASITDTNDVTATIAKTASTGDTSGGNSGGGTTGSMSQPGSESSSSDVSAKLSASVDVVKGLKTAIEAALTPNGIGKYSISSSGVITVTDTREVQEQIRELVEAENKSVGRQVRMRMQIVDVTATTNNDMGVDWSWVINQAAAKWNVNFFAPAGLPGGSTGFGQLGIIRNGGNSTTQTFLQALSTVGKVNIRKDETYTMLNNRPLSIANTENFIYPARSSPAATTLGSTTAVPGVEPGQLTTGTFLNMRASIQPNGSVIVQFSMDASMRGNTVTIESNGVKLQYPQSTANQYQIYASIVNGETAVLAGLDDSQQQATDKSFDATLTPLLGGGISTATTRRAVLVLLTPQIVEGVN